MYQYLTTTPYTETPWALRLVVWWCSLFGITDAPTIQMVVAVLVAGIFLLTIYLAVICIIGIVSGMRHGRSL